jgi:hypothetical protein
MLTLEASVVGNILVTALGRKNRYTFRLRNGATERVIFGIRWIWSQNWKLLGI